MLSPSTTSNAERRNSTAIVTSPSRKKAKTAIGVNTFRELIEESTVFVDKSLLIKEIIENADKVLLITCPRRWGKSLNMDMIKTFLEIEVDYQGNKYADKTKTSNYKLFRGMSTAENLDMPLNIAQDTGFKEIYNQYQGEYPVIYVDFKGVKGTSYQEIVDRVKVVIHKVFHRHKYMIDVFIALSKTEELNCLSITAADYLTKFLRFYKKDGQEATDIDVEGSLQFLSEVLHNHFGKKVYILMDEYDAPITHILQSDLFANEDLEKSLVLFRTMMGAAFKGNVHLEKGIITGVFRIAKSSLFSDLNNLVEFNFLNNEFARYYGFNENETETLFNVYQISKEDRDRAESWYDGYRVSTEPTLKIYNPWAIINFLRHKKIANYWEDTGNIDFIKNLFRKDAIKTKVESLLSKEVSKEDDHGHPKDYTVVNLELEDLKFTKDNLITLKDLINIGSNYKVSSVTVDLFFRYIFAAGYLTLADEQKHGSRTSVRLPNKEVESELTKKLIYYYKQIYSISDELFSNVTDELVKISTNNNTYKLKKALEDLFEAFPQFINIKESTENGVHGNEDLLHSVINYTALQIKSVTQFGTEVWYQNKGGADIILIYSEIKLGMIIELKYSGLADAALDQTEKYIPIFKKHDKIRSIKSVGISISQSKKVDIKSKLEENPYYSG